MSIESSSATESELVEVNDPVDVADPVDASAPAEASDPVETVDTVEVVDESAPDEPATPADSTSTDEPAEGSDDEAPPENQPFGPSVLIVDDNDELRETLAAMLAEEGLSATTARGPDEATQLVSSQQFDAVIIDLVMPGQHGLALMTSLRELPNGRRAAMLILSTLPLGDTREGARLVVGEQHRAAFLDKPVTPRRLLITLGRLLAVR